MKSLVLVLLALLALLVNCTASPTLPPPSQTTVATKAAEVLPTETTLPQSSATPNQLGLNIVAQYDPTAQVLTIYGVTPAATVVLGGTPLLPPPTPTQTSVPLPTNTLPPRPTPKPQVVAPKPTAVPQQPAQPVNAAALAGKILFKSTRDGGSYPLAFSYYVMDPDGSNVKKLDFAAADAFYKSIVSREGFAPDGSKVVLGERRCYSGFGTCGLYILDTVTQANIINSPDDISAGAWFSQKGMQAKDPVWSPASNYIAFVSNHESGQGCLKTVNVFKGTPGTHPKITRLTDKGDFRSGADAGHPSFSGDGARLTFWGGGSGLKQIYVLDVGADETFDYRYSNVRIISNHQADDWDPLWVK